MLVPLERGGKAGLFATLIKHTVKFEDPLLRVELAQPAARQKTFNELLEDLNGTFHRLRQSGIDEELFDVISGFEALAGSQPQ